MERWCRNLVMTIALCAALAVVPVVAEETITVGETVTVDYGFLEAFSGDLGEVRWEYSFPETLALRALSASAAVYQEVYPGNIIRGVQRPVQINDGVVASATFEAISPTTEEGGVPVPARLGDISVTALDSNGVAYTVNIEHESGVVILPPPPRPTVGWFFRYRRD